MKFTENEQPAGQTIVWGNQVVITGIDWAIGSAIDSDVILLGVCVTGDGVTTQVEEIIILREDADRIVAAIKQWKAAHGITEDPLECKKSLSPSEWQRAYLGHWDGPLE